MSATVLLTGASGYTGGRLLRRFEEGGRAVRYPVAARSRVADLLKSERGRATRGESRVRDADATPDRPRIRQAIAARMLLQTLIMHPFPHHYVVASTAIPEGDIMLSSDGLPPLATVTPREFDGPGGKWSPETLLVAAVADCFLLTFRGIARASKMPWSRLSVECEGTLERPDRTTQFTRFNLRARLSLPSNVSEAQARRILTRAEETCLITRSLNGHTELHAEIERT